MCRQILETHLGWAAHGLGKKIGKMLDQREDVVLIREFLESIYNESGREEDFNAFGDTEIIELAENLREGRWRQRF